MCGDLSLNVSVPARKSLQTGQKRSTGLQAIRPLLEVEANWGRIG
jgi:hypothetical protein